MNKLPKGVLRDLIVEQLAQLARTGTETLERSLGGETQSLAPKINKPRARPRRSGQRLEPLSKAIAYALQAPDVVDSYDGDLEILATLNLNGLDVLLEIIAEIQENSPLTTATLLSRFDNHRYVERLRDLAVHTFELPSDTFAGEFAGVIEFFHLTALESEQDALEEKSRMKSLSDIEIARIRELPRLLSAQKQKLKQQSE